MADASRDGNNVPTLLGVSNVDGVTPVRIYADPVTHRLLVDIGSVSGLELETDGVPNGDQTLLNLIAGTNINLTDDGMGGVTIDATGGSGTVTSVSVVTANGVSGSVATSTTTPAITLTLGAITPSAVQVSGLTASEIVITDGSKNLVSAAVATYPSLTELTYVKGVTSAIQTQLNAKQATITFGTGVQTALGVNIGSAGAPVLFDGALGTPSSGTVTNLTGTASININGTVGATTPTTATFTTATINTSLLPDANDGAVLGAAGTAFSDLFLAEGAVINWDSGDATITQTGNVLAVAGADLRVATADVGTNADSVPTLSSTSTLTNKTLTSPAITTGTYTGTQLLAEGASIGLDPALSADGTWSGITITGTSGYSQAFGDLVYLDPTDSRWEAADANAAAGADGDARGLLAMVVVTGTDGNACTLLLQGVIRADANFPAFTVNNPIYASETAGDVTQTQPTTTDVVIRPIGAALTADSMYFNGCQFYITHT